MKNLVRRIVWSAVGAAVLAGLPVFQRLLLLPLYLQAERQWLLSHLNRLSALLLLPGKSLVYKISPPLGHYFETLGLLQASAINFVLYWAILFALWSAIQRRRRAWSIRDAHESDDLASVNQPASPSRRAFLRNAALAGGGMVIIGGAGYPVLIRPDWLAVRRIRISIRDLPLSLSGFRIVQLTDLHHDEWISNEHIRHAVALANSLAPDLVALTGDYVTSKAALIRPTVEELAKLSAPAGVVGVMGNHDWWADAAETRKQFAAYSISLLDNRRLYVAADRTLTAVEPTAGLCIGGVGDLWEDVCDPEAALGAVAPELPRILLSHNPDLAEQGPVGDGTIRVDLMLSGHTHGGQVRLPGLGTPVVPSAYGQKYAQGLVEGPSCQVNISAGIGMGVLPVRFGVPPEIVVIELISSA